MVPLVERTQAKKIVLVTVLSIILAFFLSLILHLQTFPLLTSGISPQVLTPDPWYVLRQTETAIHAFPAYSWFDPMTGFPSGAVIGWGPFLPWLGATLSIVSGTGSVSSLIPLVSWISPVIAAIMVPLLCYAGWKLQGRVCGISSALLIAVVPGSFLIRSMYGYYDHHIFESFFLACFLLGTTILVVKAYQVHQTPRLSLDISLYAIIPGLFFGLGMLNSPTMIFSSVILALFYLILAFFILSRGDSLFPLLGIAGIGTTVGIIVSIPDILSISSTFFHPYFIVFFSFIPFFLICLLIIMGGIASRMHIRPLMLILPVILVLAVMGAVVISMDSTLSLTLIDQFCRGTTPETTPPIAIGEYHAADPAVMLFNYNLLLPLMVLGLILLVIRIKKEQDISSLMILVWTLVTLVLTLFNVRYEILFTVPLILTCASALDTLYNNRIGIFSPGRDQRDDDTVNSSTGKLLSGILLSASFLLCLLISGLIVTADYNYQPYVVSEDWVEGLLWMHNATPDTGVDYYGTYSKDTYSYPDSAYGVLSWWDYGHWITTLAHRMPVSNPFQQNLDIPARFFMAPDENGSDSVALSCKARYIITDAEMLFNSMQMMLPVYNLNQSPEDYFGVSTVLNNSSGQYETTMGYRQPFYESMVTRLHVFDGSAAAGIQSVPKETSQDLKSGYLKVSLGSDVNDISGKIHVPIKDVAALQHYRLVWESNTSLSTTGEND
ncbi:MAG: oligosaccharyl transferase, archaeosortase A system-associated, partial [Methanospirillum sp.]|nr:oligosaccharyl transferase, archaeosortase A system-associated [Methanospirillum sp.]